MPVTMGSQLNKVAESIVTPAEVAAGLRFVGVNLEATYGEGYLIDGINFGAAFFNAADFANTIVVAIHIRRNIFLDPAIAIGPQLAQAEALFTKLGDVPLQRAVERTFQTPFILPKGGRYTVYGAIGFSAPLAGNLDMFFVATGRPIPTGSDYQLSLR